MSNSPPNPLAPSKRHRLWKKFCDRAFEIFCLLSMLGCCLLLVAMLGGILWQGLPGLNWSFLVNLQSYVPQKFGIGAALAGTFWLIGLTAIISIPAGVGAALYLEEYASNSGWRKLIQLNISNLAGVPSIVYGILGLGIFVHGLHLGFSILAGALTLSLVILPIIIVATQEALRSVPPSIRTASYALGATRWQTIWRSVLPAATPGIMTGTILALSRAMGETAPIIVVGAIDYAGFFPTSPMSYYTAMPMQIYLLAENSKPEFQSLSSTAIIVLLAILISMNAVAVYIRQHYGKQIQW
ncbi:phosphate ABC transporter permease PstA [Lignipirellula cremea]|uniref:Phosphate transport system permease protein PstA n=1 Tax=Lignipirellula cremea TaxID=2528010 RepID=A0A518E2D6_9BACT|nr:phosphate ABC transporter permease PstA [Lignipirellula cremea]QDU98212.1 Phosphate transport system permease protein PstA [Lignipirellula cremea]